jgi:glycosyltransferase involved in cell wall biosynthesis
LNVNTNKLLSDGNLGFCARGDIEQMAKQIKRLLENPEVRNVMAREGKRYVSANHSIEKVVDRMENVFITTARSPFEHESRHRKLSQKCTSR